jgi:DNA-binding FadR family transcriptional regulator
MYGHIWLFQLSGRRLPAERTIAKQLNVKQHQLCGALEVLRASGEIGPLRRGAAAADCGARKV